MLILSQIRSQKCIQCARKKNSYTPIFIDIELSIRGYFKRQFTGTSTVLNNSYFQIGRYSFYVFDESYLGNLQHIVYKCLYYTGRTFHTNLMPDLITFNELIALVTKICLRDELNTLDVVSFLCNKIGFFVVHGVISDALILAR